MYQYAAKCIRVIDGDTIEVLADLGFNIHHKLMLRLDGLDTPEMNTQDGKAVKQVVIELVLNKDIVFKSHSWDKYGRSLASVDVGSINLNRHLLEKGMAKPYNGGKR